MIRKVLIVICSLFVLGLFNITSAECNTNPNPTDYYVSVMQEINHHLTKDACLSILNNIFSDDVPLHLAIIWQESDFDSLMVGDSGSSLGFYQIRVCEARTVDRKANRAVLLTLENVYYGSRYLESLLDRYSLIEALKVYNGVYRYAYQVIARKNAIESGRVFTLTPVELYRIRWVRNMEEADKYSFESVVEKNNSHHFRDN